MGYFEINDFGFDFSAWICVTGCVCPAGHLFVCFAWHNLLLVDISSSQSNQIILYLFYL